MRIVAGRNKGRHLAAPPGRHTRPTADRVRQALFDMLWHAPWGGRHAVEDALVLDAFAGTGALGLEALSRGAAGATFLETDPDALAALRSNITACRDDKRAKVVVADVLKPPRARGGGANLVFLDPPYEKGMVPLALAALGAAGWLAPAALLVAEQERAADFPAPGFTLLSERAHGTARIVVMQAAAAPD